jgi:hypothetical protein
MRAIEVIGGLLIVTCMVGACNKNKEPSAVSTEEFKEIDQDNGFALLQDKITGCEYIWTNSGITPRLTNEGKVGRGCTMYSGEDSAAKPKA